MSEEARESSGKRPSYSRGELARAWGGLGDTNSPAQAPTLVPGATPAGGQQTWLFEDLGGDKLLASAPRLAVQGHDKPLPALGGIPLLRKVGQGGMGAVYYGYQPRLNREVAVKVLPFQLAERQPELVERFFREARAAAKVRSPHLVTVFDVDTENDICFLVMEFVRGASAGQYLKALKRHSPPIVIDETVALDICIAAAEGLAAAHREGIIHRDVKPDNILIPSNQEGTILQPLQTKLADLGLARDEDIEQSLTGSSFCLGTPGYMSPEQAWDSKHVGKPADVFSLGATLYALLAGQAPFAGPSPLAVLDTTRSKPHCPVRELRSDISEATAVLLNRCLSKVPFNRYPDGGALVVALRECRSCLGRETMAVPNPASLLSVCASGSTLPPVSIPSLPGTWADPLTTARKRMHRRWAAWFGVAAVALFLTAVGLTLLPRSPGPLPPSPPAPSVSPSEKALRGAVAMVDEERIQEALQVLARHLEQEPGDVTVVACRLAVENVANYQALQEKLDRVLRDVRTATDGRDEQALRGLRSVEEAVVRGRGRLREVFRARDFLPRAEEVDALEARVLLAATHLQRAAFALRVKADVLLAAHPAEKGREGQPEAAALDAQALQFEQWGGALSAAAAASCATRRSESSLHRLNLLPAAEQEQAWAEMAGRRRAHVADLNWRMSVEGTTDLLRDRLRRHESVLEADEGQRRQVEQQVLRAETELTAGRLAQSREALCKVSPAERHRAARRLSTVAQVLAMCEPGAPGLLRNGDFEDGWKAWGTGYYEFAREGEFAPFWVSWTQKGEIRESPVATGRIEAGGFGGGRALRIEYQSEAQLNHYATTCQRVAGVKPGTCHLIVYWVKAREAQPATLLLILDTIHKRDGRELRPPWVNRKGIVKGSYDWRPFWIAFQTEDASDLDVRIVSQSPGTVWIDRLCLQEAWVPSATEHATRP